MVFAVEKFRRTQTSHNDSEATATKMRLARTAATEALQLTKRQTLAAIARDMTDFDTKGFTNPNVPEDVIAEGHALRERIEARTREEALSPYAELLLAPLDAALETAETAARAAYEAKAPRRKPSTPTAPPPAPSTTS